MTTAVVVLSTAESAEEAEKIARAVVSKRLAACVNIVPSIRSIYRWEGKVEDASEHLLLMKTSREVLPLLEAEIKAQHSYQVPEIIALSIEEASKTYLDWVIAETEP